MALSIDWATRIITIPKADLTLVSGSIYELNALDFHNWLLDIHDTETGMAYPDSHNHNIPVSVSGITLARVVEMINDYSVTFEDGQYAVNIVGGNTNIADVTNVNQVSIRPFNSAGLIDNSLATVGNDDEAPTWVAAVGITDLYQDGSNLTARWGVAVDNFNEQVSYNVYMSEFNTDIYESFNLVQTVDGNLTTLRYSDTALTPFVNNTTYYVGIRAIDQSGNETTNTNYSEMLYEESAAGDIAAEVWSYGTRLLTSDPVAGDVNVVSLSASALSDISSSVWAETARTLTATLGLTPEQEAKLDQILLDVEEEARKIRNTTIAMN